MPKLCTIKWVLCQGFGPLVNPGCKSPLELPLGEGDPPEVVLPPGAVAPPGVNEPLPAPGPLLEEEDPPPTTGVEEVLLLLLELLEPGEPLYTLPAFTLVLQTPLSAN